MRAISFTGHRKLSEDTAALSSGDTIQTTAQLYKTAPQIDNNIAFMV